MDEVSFPCEVEWQCYRLCRKRVNIFLTFSRDIIPEPDFASRMAVTRKTPAFGGDELPLSPASGFFWDTAYRPLSSANREANYLCCDE
jgi:hypothetical protein